LFVLVEDSSQYIHFKQKNESAKCINTQFNGHQETYANMQTHFPPSVPLLPMCPSFPLSLRPLTSLPSLPFLPSITPFLACNPSLFFVTVHERLPPQRALARICGTRETSRGHPRVPADAM
jgi:hypothetical protein